MRYAKRYLKKRKFSGRGAYSSNSLIRGVKRFAKSPVGRAVGKGVMSVARAAFSGRGAYTTNQLIDNPTHPRSVNQVDNETGDVYICHSEYLQDIIPTTSSFQTQFFSSVNPGLPGFLPWLSQLAEYFEEYEFVECIPEFRSLVSSGNNSASGNVIMATQYNAAAGAFTSKQYMENYDYANSVKVTDSAYHGIECAHSKSATTPLLYVRAGSVPTGQDPKTYDIGVFQLATSGCVATLALGELWVHYKVRLSKAKVVLPGASSALTAALAVGFGFGSVGAWRGGIPNWFNIAGGGDGAPATSTNVLYPASIVAQTAATSGTEYNLIDTSQGGMLFGYFNAGAYNGSNPAGTCIQFPTWCSSGTYCIQFVVEMDSSPEYDEAFTVDWQGYNCSVTVFVSKVFASKPAVWQAIVNLNSAQGSTAAVFFNLGTSYTAAQLGTQSWLTVNQLPGAWPANPTIFV